MNITELEKFLQDILFDDQFSRNEKNALKDLLTTLEPDELNFLRNRSFEIAQEKIKQGKDALNVLHWLEELVKTISHQDGSIIANAYFSPGEDVKKRLIALCEHASRSLDVCVFTIADDQLCQALIDAHRKGVIVRVITDDEKTKDKGSDIYALIRAGIEVRTDDDPAHMHHKFVIRDKAMLASGSFNWTRSATTKNQENIIVTNEKSLVRDFLTQFDTLWKDYENNA